MKQTREPLALAEVQQAVDRWIGRWDDGYWHPLANLAQLTEEVGELARAINHRHGPKPPKTGEAIAEGQQQIVEEMGDVLFVLAALANSMDISLEDAMRGTLAKIEARDSERFTPKREEPAG